MSAKDALLAACDKRRHKTVEVGGATFRIRNLLAGEYAKVEACITQAVAAKGAGKAAALAKGSALMLVLCLVDDDGNQIFSEADVDRLEQLDYGVASALFAACTEHSNIDTTDLDALAKN